MLVSKNGGAGGGCPVAWEKNGIGKYTDIREIGVNKGIGHLGEGRGEDSRCFESYIEE